MMSFRKSLVLNRTNLKILLCTVNSITPLAMCIVHLVSYSLKFRPDKQEMVWNLNIIGRTGWKTSATWQHMTKPTQETINQTIANIWYETKWKKKNIEIFHMKSVKCMRTCKQWPTYFMCGFIIYIRSFHSNFKQERTKSEKSYAFAWFLLVNLTK